MGLRLRFRDFHAASGMRILESMEVEISSAGLPKSEAYLT